MLRTLDVIGHAELRDPRNKVAARGERISAIFVGINQLSTAAVHGTPDRFGLVHASPYTVGGERVDLDWEAQNLHVDGPARLRFKAERSLQGRRRPQAVPVDVTCTESLDVDGLRNTVHLAGYVVARSGEEQLRSDTLTLLLEDVVEPEQEEPTPPTLRDLLRDARQLLAQRQTESRHDDALDLQAANRSSIRKEPVRLIADNALLQSESYEPGDAQPMVHSSIAAPTLEVDIVRREISTKGETTLLVADRRMEATESSEREGFGIPSRTTQPRPEPDRHAVRRLHDLRARRGGPGAA